jgi:glycosyltransferase involved in cell wall biosynthesis
MDERDFIFDPGKYPGERAPGISGFMRLRNEAEFLPKVIETWLPHLDELVIVHNRCDDGTDVIAGDFARLSKKVKVHHYGPHVYPQGSTEYMRLPPDSPHSLVNYYNYALSKTTRTVCAKVDGDDIAIPNKIKFTADEIRKRGGIPPGEFWMFTGINLWRDNDRVMINGAHPFCGFDHGFFNAARDVYFLKGAHCEYLGGGLTVKKTGFMYYHAKGLKKDRGNVNYDFDKDPGSAYTEPARKEIETARPITYHEFMAEWPQAVELQYLPPPEQLIILNE